MEMTRCLGHDWFPAQWSDQAGWMQHAGGRCLVGQMSMWARICGCKSAREMKSDFVSGEPSSHSARHASTALLAHAWSE